MTTAKLTIQPKLIAAAWAGILGVSLDGIMGANLEHATLAGIITAQNAIGIFMAGQSGPALSTWYFGHTGDLVVSGTVDNGYSLEVSGTAGEKVDGPLVVSGSAITLSSTTGVIIGGTRYTYKISGTTATLSTP